VQLDIPPEGETPARRIRSNTLQGSGGAEGLRNATFTGAVEYRETQAARGKTAAIDRTAHSDQLDATLKPGFGAPEAAVFRGHASVSDGDTSGEAGVINYAPDKNLMTLDTPAGTPGSAPRITDPKVTISAKWIELTLDPRKLNAKGSVKSILKEADQKTEDRSQKAEDRRQKTAGVRRPAMLNDRDPVNVTAAALQYDATTSKGIYTGGARLWQGETTIQGETLVIDDNAGNLTATKQVRTRMMLEQVNDKTKKTESVESIGTADDFVYEDDERRATYTTKAHLTGPQGDLAAKKIVLFLNEDGRTLNRAEAYDDVVAKLEGGQQAFGARLTYFAADERYLMTGTPVKILEIVEGGCRETLGASLTFIRSTDTISVVGTEGNRSRTMPGRCAGSR
jgi:lipopolysaccharide transport protein LptA